MEAEVFVVGGGGHAKVVVATLQAAGYRVKGIYDDDPGKQGQEILGIPVVGTLEDAEAREGVPGIVAVGDNRLRQQIARRLHRWKWIAVVHPAAWVHPSVTLGEGTVVFAGAVIQPDAHIGAHGIVNTGASVDHDCMVGDFVHIAPGVRLAGGVALGEGVLMGIGSVATPGVRIGAWTTVGAGAAVVRDLPSRVVAVGVPARVIREKEAS